jgi:hypothetical protein
MSEPMFEKLWVRRRLTTVWAFTACYRENFGFFDMTIIRKKLVGAFVGVMSHSELKVLRKKEKLTMRKVGTNSEPANMFCLFICVFVVVQL